MRNLLLMACLLMACLLLAGHPFAFGQMAPSDSNVLFGPAHRLPEGGKSQQIIGVHPGGYYSLVRGKDKFTLQSLDASLRQVQESQFTLGEADARREYESAVQMQGNVYLFSSLTSEDKKKTTLFAQALNRESLLPGPDLVKVGETDARQRDDDGAYLFKLSADSTRLLVYCRGADRKGQPERVSFRVLDPQLRVLWAKDASLPYEDELFVPGPVAVDNQGRVLVAGLHFEDKPKYVAKDKPNYRYHVLCYNADAENPYDYVVEAGDRFITGLKIAPARGGKLICSGFYSEKSPADLKGTFYQTLAADGKAPSKMHFQALPPAFIAQVRGRKKVNESDEIYSCHLDHLVAHEPGGAFLVGEVRFHSGAQQSLLSGTNYTMSSAAFKDIVVVRLNADGTIAWCRSVPKHQQNGDIPYFYSYFLASTGKHLHFLFSDHHRNANPEPGQMLTVLSGMVARIVVRLATLDDQGNLTRSVLVGHDDNRPITYTGLSSQPSRGAVIMQGKLFGEYRYSRFKLTE